MATLMRILFLTPQLPYPPRQGATLRNYNLIRHLAKHHTVDLLTFLAPGDQLLDDNALRNDCRRIAGIPQPARTQRSRARTALTTRLPDMALRLESPEMHTQVAAWLTTTRYDVVQLEGIEMAPYGFQVAASAPQPRPFLIFDDHNCEYLLQWRNAITDLRHPARWLAAAYSLLQWQKLRRYEREICRIAAATIAVSEPDRAALARLLPGLAATVIPNGIDPAGDTPPSASPSREPGLILFVGKMDYRPNIDAVLWFSHEVLPLILRDSPAARFLIVGQNPHPRLAALAGHPQIEIIGGVPDVLPYIQRASVYVIPMRVGGGTRFKALEAMAAACAIVSTTLGVEGIGVTSGQEMLIADDPAAFAAAVLRLFVDQRQGGGLSRQLGKAGHAFVHNHYDWSVILPALDNLYSSL